MSQYNSMFMFGTEETYADITAPLRLLLCKNAVFEWTKTEVEITVLHIYEGG